MALNRDKILRDAEKLVHKGKVEQAIREYEKVLKLNPNDTNTINRVGDLYGRVGQVDKAIELYERIANSFTKDGFTTKAIAILKKINRLVPQRLDIFNRLAELYIQQGLLVEAKSQYQMLADWYAKNGDNEQAIEVHKKLVQLDPHNHMAHLRLADLLMQVEQPEEAVEVYGRLGGMLLQREKLDEAERLYRHALEQDPPTGEFLEPLCHALLEAGKAPSAQEFLAEALERSPDSASLQVLEVRVSLGLGKAEEALDRARQLLQARPHDRDVRCVVGRVFLSAGEAAQARDLLVPAVEDFLNRGEYQDAQQLLQELLKAVPQDPQILEVALRAFEPSGDTEMIFTLKASLADSHFRSGKEKAAGRLYAELLKAEPANALFRQRLAKVNGVTEAGSGAVSSDVEEDLGPVDDVPEPEIIEFDVPDDDEIGVFEEQTQGAIQPVSAPASGVASQFDPTERLAEANVFAKYGLVDKAIHHLDEIVRYFPDHFDALEKLVLLYVEQHKPEAALEIVGPLVEHYRETGDSRALQMLETSLPQFAEAVAGPAEAVEFSTETVEEEDEGVLVLDLDEGEEALAGYDEDAVATVSQAQQLEFEVVEDLEGPDDEFSLVVDLDELTEVPLEEPDVAEVEPEIVDVGSMELEPQVEGAPLAQPSLSSFGALAPETSVLPGTEDDELVPLDLEPAQVWVDEAPPEAAGDAAPGGSDEAGVDVLEFEEVDLLSADSEVPASDVEVPAADPSRPASDSAAPILSELDELERSIMGERARPKSPATPRATITDEDLAEALVMEIESLAPTAPSPSLDAGVADDLVELSTSFTGPSLSDLQQIDFFVQQELYDDAIRLLDRLEEEFPGDSEIAERRLVLKSKGVLLEEVAVGGEGPEELFADEEEYIDLAKELEEELAEEEAMVEEATGRGRDEALLEEVFREFQKGVSEQLSEEDSDTHFNLGIAYKEMGLLPEAIREFQVAGRSPEYFIECCSMIGVCYVEQGMFDQAAEWYNKALHAPDIGDDARLALRYDLASALEMDGETAQAMDLFEEIASLDPTYRDVADRRAALSQQHHVN